jgi:hypothetical protein
LVVQTGRQDEKRLWSRLIADPWRAGEVNAPVSALRTEHSRSSSAKVLH